MILGLVPWANFPWECTSFRHVNYLELPTSIIAIRRNIFLFVALYQFNLMFQILMKSGADRKKCTTRFRGKAGKRLNIIDRE